MTFLQLAQKVLEEEKRPLHAEEIWQVAVEKGYDSLVGTKGKTPWSSIGAQMYVQIRDKADCPFGVTDARPKKFFLLALGNRMISSSEKPPVAQLPKQTKPEYLEKHLHPFLAYFGFYHLNCFSKTLNHSKSGKGEFGEWVHPDMVGCSFQFNDWRKEVTEFSRAIGNVTIHLYSFEIKRKLGFANLREAFFQAVSNSSWANEGYLVASEISNDEDFRNELARLSSSFGIGVIKLDVQDADAGEVIFPARFRENLDWDTINKLTMNPDFKEFITRVKKDINSNEVYKEQYDFIKSREELKASIAEKV